MQWKERSLCSSCLRKNNTPFITPWKQGVQLEIDTRYFAASLTSLILLTSSWLLWNYPLPFLAVFTRASPFIVLTDSWFMSSLPSHFRRNSTLLLGRDIDRGFAAEKITAIRDNVAPCTHSPYVLSVCSRSREILDIPRYKVLPGWSKLIRSRVVLYEHA